MHFYNCFVLLYTIIREGKSYEVKRMTEGCTRLKAHFLKWLCIEPRNINMDAPCEIDHIPVFALNLSLQYQWKDFSGSYL